MHHSTNPGKRVRVVLQDGTSRLDRFVERTGKYMVFKKLGRVRVADVKQFIVKPEASLPSRGRGE